ncbi:MAG: pilus assembly protein PilM [Dehalococcoidales bacterium]|jgi:Tfp pilus assembly protein PilN
MYVALNISSTNIKVLSLKGNRVNKYAGLDLADGLVRDGLILQPQAVGEAVNTLFKSTGLPRDKVVFSIAGLSFTYRFISLPRMKPALIEESILRAAKKEISLPLEELYLSWQPIPGKETEQSYFILGVPRNFIDAAVETLKSTNVPPYMMDLRPLALARTVQRSNVIVVNLDADCFDIVFITGGLPTVIHTISPRGEGATLEENIRRLSDELTKTAAFYQSDNPEAQINPATPLIITGDLAEERQVGDLINAEIEYPVEPFIPPVAAPDDFPAAAYASSIGLALKGAPLKTLPGSEQSHFMDINVNLLAGKYRKPKAKPVSSRYIWLSVALVIAVGLLYPLYQARQHAKTDNLKLATEFSNVQRELNLASLVDEETINAESTIADITAAAAAVRDAKLTILNARGDYGAGLRLVTGAMPPQISFTWIEIRPEDITIKGETDSVFSALAYAAALESQNHFTDVRVTSLDENVVETGAPDETTVITVITFEIYIQK